MNRLIGRDEEKRRLEEFYSSGKPEFIAVYGRRRVGKTFLIDTCFRGKYDFYVSGIIEGSMADELSVFNLALKEYGGQEMKSAKTWEEAFRSLRGLLEAKANQERILVFIDELPCFDTPRSGFLKALDNFWNGWASKQQNLMLIVCGSATSWMVEKIIDSHGGLHNRISHEMHIRPFDLAETEKYLKEADIRWSRLNISQLYMIIGGIPYYLSLLRRTESLAQNIDRLFFATYGELRREYDRLFHALFRKPEKYMKVVECLSKSRVGLTRQELLTKLSATSSEEVSRILRNLEYCDFIRSYSTNGNARAMNGRCYQLIDFFTLFYIKFCIKPSTDPHFWTHNLDKSIENDWYGIMFEILCVNHIDQIKRALGISGIYTEYCGWRSQNETRAQIDLLIERSDDVIDLCEMKYSKKEYALTKAEYEKLERRRAVFEEEAKTHKGIRYVLITTAGLKEGKYSYFFDNTITLSSLFTQ